MYFERLYAGTYHGTTTFRVEVMGESIKRWISQEWNMTFSWKKVLNCESKTTFSEVVTF